MLGPEGFSEEQWEQLALEALAEQDWEPLHGVRYRAGSGERESWADPVIPGRLLEAMRRLNPEVPTEYLKQAHADILSPKSQDALTENQRIHGFLVEGYRGISYVDTDGTEQTPDDPAGQRAGPTRTTGWRSTRSPFAPATTSAASTWCSTATGCRSRSSS